TMHKGHDDDSGRNQVEANYVTHSLTGEGHDASEDGTGRGTPVVAFNWQSGGDCRLGMREDTDALHVGQTPAVAFDTTQVTSKLNRSNPKPGDPCHPLAAGAHPPALASAMAVRRLTPTECERLQAFPDGWTCLCQPLETYDADRCTCPDSPRYRAMGNAVTVNVIEWIGRRLREVSAPAAAAPTGAPS
ncbi:MAG TPA: DNA cytosine methyltransferase, partial [Terriglobales bacterium]|nr:DNA cytosine methyltransferase [Terriglobales bacterium]